MLLLFRLSIFLCPSSFQRSIWNFLLERKKKKAVFRPYKRQGSRICNVDSFNQLFFVPLPFFWQLSQEIPIISSLLNSWILIDTSKEDMQVQNTEVIARWGQRSDSFLELWLAPLWHHSCYLYFNIANQNEIKYSSSGQNELF